MKINPRNPGHWWVLFLQLLYTWLAILLRPFLKKPPRPVIVLYGHQFAGNLQALYRQWENFHREEYDLFYLTLDQLNAHSLKEQKIKFLCCFRLKDMLVLARARILISDHGLHLMTPLIRWTDIKFIDVWHGIPFKGFGPDDFKLQHKYNEVWVSSPLLSRLYQDQFGFDQQRVKALGYARTDALFQRPSPESKFRSHHNIRNDHKLILYAPTWQQDQMGRELFPFGLTQDEFLKKVSSLCEERGGTLVVRSHQNSRVSESDYGHVIFCPQHRYPDTEDLLLASDILICDWSSIAFDYVALERPTIFLDVPPPFKKGFSLGADYRFGAIVSKPAALTESLSEYLLQPDSYMSKYRNKHLDVIEKVYGENTDGHSARRQWERLAQLL
jgi:CDP-glycerol glycerophosphotransferase